MNHSTNHRDDKGRFMAGNPYAAAGGRARAERLSPARRREIAQAGFRALVERHFDGDRELAKRYIGEVGAWAGDAYRGTRWQHFVHPGTIEAFRERLKPFDMLKTKPTEGGTA